MKFLDLIPIVAALFSVAFTIIVWAMNIGKMFNRFENVEGSIKIVNKRIDDNESQTAARTKEIEQQIKTDNDTNQSALKQIESDIRKKIEIAETAHNADKNEYIARFTKLEVTLSNMVDALKEIHNELKTFRHR